MSVERWIHCNKCYHPLARKERKFYHLSCHHVLCKQCMAKTNRGTMCPVCQKPLERFTELNNRMERKEKMYYDPGSLKMLSVGYQSVVFQHKHREHLIRGILRCRVAITQMKEMENVLRQRIVETQRRYEKFRTYRRNLQESLRQISPRAPAAHLQHIATSALPNRVRDSSSRSNERATTTSQDALFVFTTPSHSNRIPTPSPSPSSVLSFPTPDTGPQRKNFSQRSNVDCIAGEGSSRATPKTSTISDDSGISGMRTPSSNQGGFSRGSPYQHSQRNRILGPMHPATPFQKPNASYYPGAPPRLPTTKPWK